MNKTEQWSQYQRTWMCYFWAGQHTPMGCLRPRRDRGTGGLSAVQWGEKGPWVSSEAPTSLRTRKLVTVFFFLNFRTGWPFSAVGVDKIAGVSQKNTLQIRDWERTSRWESVTWPLREPRQMKSRVIWSPTQVPRQAKHVVIGWRRDASPGVKAVTGNCQFRDQGDCRWPRELMQHTHLPWATVWIVSLPKSICWSSNPHVTVFGNRAFRK